MAELWHQVHELVQSRQRDGLVEVVFREKTPLGMRLVRAGNSANVGYVDPRGVGAAMGVTLGSALASINGQDVLTMPYQDKMDVLANAQWPLSLLLKSAPRKEGMLSKRQRKAALGKPGWKARFVQLANGSICHYSEPAGGVLKGQLTLSGCTIGLVPEAAAGRSHCFQVEKEAEGTALLLACGSAEELVDWCASTYLAIQQANGEHGAADDAAAGGGQQQQQAAAAPSPPQRPSAGGLAWPSASDQGGGSRGAPPPQHPAAPASSRGAWQDPAAVAEWAAAAASGDLAAAAKLLAAAAAGDAAAGDLARALQLDPGSLHRMQQLGATPAGPSSPYATPSPRQAGSSPSGWPSMPQAPEPTAAAAADQPPPAAAGAAAVARDEYYSPDPRVHSVLLRYKDAPLPEHADALANIEISVRYGELERQLKVPNPRVHRKAVAVLWPHEVKRAFGFSGTIQDMWITPLALVGNGETLHFERSEQHGGMPVVHAQDLEDGAYYEVEMEDRRQDALDKLSEEQQAHIRNNFESYDDDNSGSVSREEVEHGVRTKTEQRRKRLIEQYQTFLQKYPHRRAEADEMLRTHNAKLREAEEKMIDMFQKADLDENGQLDWQEYSLAEAWWLSSSCNPDKVELFS